MDKIGLSKLNMVNQTDYPYCRVLLFCGVLSFYWLNSGRIVSDVISANTIHCANAGLMLANSAMLARH